MGRRTKEGQELAPISVELTQAEFIQPEAQSIEVANLPKEWESADKLGGFPPSPSFERPGEAVFGIFVNCRLDVGPNHSRLYEMMAHKGADKKPELIGVWGSTAIDRMFDSASPPVKPGDKIGIIFLGTKDTKRGLNPVKLFNLLIKRPEQKGMETHAPSTGAQPNGGKVVDITPKQEKESKPQAAHASK